MRYATATLLFLVAGFTSQAIAQDDADPAAEPRVDLPLPGYLGIIVEERGRAGGGLRIIEVKKDGPAEKAGVKVGDIVVTLRGRPVNRPQDLGTVMFDTRPGDKIKLRFSREGAQGEVQIALSEPPARPKPKFNDPIFPPRQGDAPANGDALLGVRTDLPTARDLVRIRAPAQFTRGALIAEVVAGSPAAAARIPLGSLIVSVDGHRVDSPAELNRRIKTAGAGRLVEIGYVNNGQIRSGRVRLVSRRDAARPPAAKDRAGDAAVEARIRRLERRMTALEQRIVDMQRALDRILDKKDRDRKKF